MHLIALIFVVIWCLVIAIYGSWTCEHRPRPPIRVMGGMSGTVLKESESRNVAFRDPAPRSYLERDLFGYRLGVRGTSYLTPGYRHRPIGQSGTTYVD